MENMLVQKQAVEQTYVTHESTDRYLGTCCLPSLTILGDIFLAYSP